MKKISKKTLSQIEQGIENMKNGKVFGPINTKWNKLSPEKRQELINKGCQKNRRECGKLSKAKRDELLKEGMRIVNESNFKDDPKPRIEILKFTPQKDGSALMDYEVNDAFIRAYMLDSKAKRFTKTGLNKWVLSKLKESIKNFKNEKSNKKN